LWWVGGVAMADKTKSEDDHVAALIRGREPSWSRYE
jgi:hypothetical protein